MSRPPDRPVSARLEALREKLAAGTPGPWRVEEPTNPRLRAIETVARRPDRECVVCERPVRLKSAPAVCPTCGRAADS